MRGLFSGSSSATDFCIANARFDVSEEISGSGMDGLGGCFGMVSVIVTLFSNSRVDINRMVRIWMLDSSNLIL